MMWNSACLRQSTIRENDGETSSRSELHWLGRIFSNDVESNGRVTVTGIETWGPSVSSYPRFIEVPRELRPKWSRLWLTTVIGQPRVSGAPIDIVRSERLTAN